MFDISFRNLLLQTHFPTQMFKVSSDPKVSVSPLTCSFSFPFFQPFNPSIQLSSVFLLSLSLMALSPSLSPSTSLVPSFVSFLCHSSLSTVFCLCNHSSIHLLSSVHLLTSLLRTPHLLLSPFNHSIPSSCSSSSLRCQGNSNPFCGC